MARELGKLYVGIDCDNCGVHGEGVPADNGKTRCGKCGQYGEQCTEYCAEHDLDYTNTPGSGCPWCEEEQRIHDMEMEMHERRADPQMHPSVDAPRW